MPNFVVFDPATGEILRSGFCMDDALIFQARDGEAVIECDFSVKYGTHYVNPVTREPMVMPDKPSSHHRWDWESYSWQQDRALAEKSVRSKRAALLNASVDRINAVRWAAMDDTTRADWDTYRTALLDITDQEGFPFTVVWPVFPQDIA